jgi:hypothetical protein
LHDFRAIFDAKNLHMRNHFGWVHSACSVMLFNFGNPGHLDAP